MSGILLWWSCQSPLGRSCSLLNHPNSFHGGMFKLNAKFVADSLLCSISHFECHSHTVHMLTQRRLPPPVTSTVKSSLFHFPWLPGFINVAQTIPVLWTMAEPFLDKPSVYMCVTMQIYIYVLYIHKYICIHIYACVCIYAILQKRRIYNYFERLAFDSLLF